MSFLPDPQIIENLSLSSIIENIKSKYLHTHPDITFTETSPLYELTAQFAYRELLLRARINDVADRLLQDLIKAYEEKRVATGSLAYYTAKTLEIQGIIDLEIASKENGIIIIYVLFDPEILKKEPDILKKTDKNLNSHDTKLLSDHVTVKEATKRLLGIKAHLILEKGTQIDIETVKKTLNLKLQPYLKIGKGLSTSVLTSMLFNTGVLDIQLKEPSTSIAPTEGEILILHNVELTYELR